MQLTEILYLPARAALLINRLATLFCHGQLPDQAPEPPGGNTPGAA